MKVAFGIFINHGGGYAYRLCPANEPQMEACFQRNHLKFAGDICTGTTCEGTSVIHFPFNGKNVTIPALSTTKGTLPVGSAWRRNPIPLGPPGIGHGQGLFPPPCDGCNGDFRDFSVIDEVEVPASLAPGNYTLSWRWDTEETPQIWNNCGDVEVTMGQPMVV